MSKNTRNVIKIQLDIIYIMFFANLKNSKCVKSKLENDIWRY